MTSGSAELPGFHVLNRAIGNLRSDEHVQGGGDADEPGEPLERNLAVKCRFRQALANLVGNALRHAPGGTAIRVAAGLQDSWVWMAVEDRGPGISAEDQERVWQRFWRGDKRRAREEGRSGLGLSIVKSIVERHGGRVQLLSELGKGATFILWFPYSPPGWSAPVGQLTP